MNFYENPITQDYSYISTPYNETSYYAMPETIHMATSGTLSLGTSAGVGQCACFVTMACPSGLSTLTSQNARDISGISAIQCGYIITGAHEQGVASWSFDTCMQPDSAVCQILRSCSGCMVSISSAVASCEADGYVFLGTCYGNGAFGVCCNGVISIHVGSNGCLTLKDSENVSWGSNNYGQVAGGMYHDQKSKFIYVNTYEGPSIYCYNSSDGSLTVCSFCYAIDSMGRGIYAMDFYGCCYLLTANDTYGIYAYCLHQGTNCICTGAAYYNSGNCKIGCGYSSTSAGYGMVYGINSNCPACHIWGGCATHCDADDGGFFVTSNGRCLYIMCLWRNNLNPFVMCLKCSYELHNSGWSSCQIHGVSGDDEYIYVIQCSWIQVFSISTSGAVTRVSCCPNSYSPVNGGRYTINAVPNNSNYASTCHVWVSRRSEWVSNSSQNGRLLAYTKPAKHRSIRGLFGGSAPDAISEYYAGGSYVPSWNSGVPTSGEITFSDFYNAGK